MPITFEWDEQKNRQNIEKHGISFGELQQFLTVECYNGKIIEKIMAKNDGLRLDEQNPEFYR